MCLKVFSQSSDGTREETRENNKPPAQGSGGKHNHGMARETTQFLRDAVVVVVVVVVRTLCICDVSVHATQRMHLIGWQNTWEQAPGVPATPSPPYWRGNPGRVPVYTALKTQDPMACSAIGKSGGNPWPCTCVHGPSSSRHAMTSTIGSGTYTITRQSDASTHAAWCFLSK